MLSANKLNSSEMGFLPIGGMSSFDFDAYNPASNSGNGNGLTNRILTVISQGIAAFGKNPTTQTVQGTIPIYSPNNGYQTNQQTYTQADMIAYQQQQQALNGGLGSSAVNTASGGIDALARSFGISTSTLMLVGGVGLFLLLKSPPGRR